MLAISFSLFWCFVFASISSMAFGCLRDARMSLLEWILEAPFMICTAMLCAAISIFLGYSVFNGGILGWDDVFFNLEALCLHLNVFS